jgi:hypothetical protein
MDDRLLRIEAAIKDLERTLGAVERRLAALESARAIEPDDERVEPNPLRVGRLELAQTVSYVGRSLVALGGAFLLRAITDANVVPHAAGIAGGLAYALFWLATAHRTGATDRLNATFHALVTAVIAYPLLWEATIRFSVLSPTASAIAVGIVTALAIGVALHRSIQTIAWIATISLLVTAVALVAATATVLPFAILLIVAGTATLWIGYARDWTILRWPVAAVANLLVIGLTMRVATTSGTEGPFTVVAVQMLLLNVYIASIAIRTIVRARNVNVFEVLQTLAALAVGFGGAVYVAHRTGSGIVALAVVNLVAGSSCYAIAWLFVAKRQGLTRNFYYYTTLAIVLLMVSSRLLLDDGALALTSAALAIAAIVLSRRTKLTALLWHSAAYLTVAAFASGAAFAAYDAFVGSASTAWRPFTTIALLVIASSIVCWLIAPRVVFGSLALWIAGGWLISVVAPPLCGVAGSGANAGGVATVRTIVLAAAALAIARIAQLPKFREIVWLLYMILAAGAIKLLVEDLPQSKPSTLFVALAFYGAALIAASRLGHRRTSSP